MQHPRSVAPEILLQAEKLFNLLAISGMVVAKLARTVSATQQHGDLVRIRIVQNNQANCIY